MESNTQILKCKPTLLDYQNNYRYFEGLVKLFHDRGLNHTEEQKKSMDWFLYDKNLRHERVKGWLPLCQSLIQMGDDVITSLHLTFVWKIQHGINVK